MQGVLNGCFKKLGKALPGEMGRLFSDALRRGNLFCRVFFDDALSEEKRIKRFE